MSNFPVAALPLFECNLGLWMNRLSLLMNQLWKCVITLSPFPWRTWLFSCDLGQSGCETPPGCSRPSVRPAWCRELLGRGDTSQGGGGISHLCLCCCCLYLCCLGHDFKWLFKWTYMDFFFKQTSDFMTRYVLILKYSIRSWNNNTIFFGVFQKMNVFTRAAHAAPTACPNQ